MKNKAFEALSNISGLPKKEVNKIWEEVKANQKLLKECKRPHLFTPIDDVNKINCKYECAKCKGIVTQAIAKAYIEGFRDGYMDGFKIGKKEGQNG